MYQLFSPRPRTNLGTRLSRHVIEVQEIGFKKFGTELREVGLQQILAGSVITCLEPLLNCQCYFKFWGCTVTLERNILRLR